MTNLDRFDELLDRRVSFRAVALLRVLAGPVVLLHLHPFLRDAAAGRIYRDSFYEPYASWYPELPRPVYVAMLVVGAASAVLMSIGLMTRLACVMAFAVVSYNVMLSTTHVHNNRAYLMIVLGLVAVAPSGRELSIDAVLRRRTGRAARDPRAPAWPLWLLRFEVSVVYGASAVSKLVDPDWFGGTVTWGRITRVRDRIDRQSPLPDWFISVLADRSVHTYAAKAIVLTELFIAVALWSRHTRLAAVWIAVWFHVMIELSASVQVFSYLAVSALVIWAAPCTRDRTVVLDRSNVRHRVLAGLVRPFDWLARFTVGPGTRGGAIRLIDRDGAVLTGRDAVVTILSRLPLTAMAALPISGWLRVRAARRGRRSTAAAPA